MIPVTGVPPTSQSPAASVPRTTASLNEMSVSVSLSVTAEAIVGATPSRASVAKRFEPSSGPPRLEGAFRPVTARAGAYDTVGSDAGELSAACVSVISRSSMDAVSSGGSGSARRPTCWPARATVTSPA